MKRLITFSILILAVVASYAADAVSWSISLENNGTDRPSIVAKAEVAPGYHLYAIDNPEGGSQPLKFYFDLNGCQLKGSVTADKAYIVEYDDVFEVNQHYYTGTVVFRQELQPMQKDYSADVEIKGQACNDTGCVPLFAQKSFSGNAPLEAVVSAKADEKTRLADPAKDNGNKSGAVVLAEMTDSLQSSESLLMPAANLSGVGANESWWENVEAELLVFSDNPEQQKRSLLYILIAGFIGGLIALVTPCVWPMIPMTVSFFLKQNKSKRKSVETAVTYGLSIIIIYLALGLAVTVLFGASALNELATSAAFNVAFFLLLVVFAASFMGGFELTLPSSWTNKMDSKVDSTTGWMSIFFMAFTLVLVSFSCTGPIIGTLLVEAAATSNFISPAVGMFGFALALALPFSLFAMFPTLLKSMPKSGGWMNTVKVVLGFLELALALKFLSVADLAYGWRILDREVFLCLWIVIFALLGMYLLGKLTFPHDVKEEKTGIIRFFLACISFSFALYMVPGLWGAPLKSISAFAPPAYTQDFSLYEGEVVPATDDFERGMELGRQLGKPVLLDFSGYGCVNCRKLEGAVWTDPNVKSTIEKDFVLVNLMVDEKRELAEPVKVTEKDGTVRTLRTYGDKWSYLQRSKFGANAQPFHVIVGNDGKPLAAPFVYKEDVDAYMRFLDEALDNFRK